MLTKRQLCEATGIVESTFNYWLNQGLLPEASGVDRQRSLWTDDALERVRYIRDLKAGGKTLLEIREALLARLMEERRRIEADKRIDEIMRDDERQQITEEALRECVLRVIGVTDIGQTVDVFPGGSGNRRFIYGVAPKGAEVVFVKIDVTTTRCGATLEKITVPLEIFSEMMGIMAREYASQGHFFNSHGLAVWAFEIQENFQRIQKLAEARHQTWTTMSELLERIASQK